jgi:hypothetical protein
VGTSSSSRGTISASVAKSFKEVFEKLSEAQVERYMDFQHGHFAGGYQKSLEVLETGGESKMLATLEALVGTTIRRD